MPFQAAAVEAPKGPYPAAQVQGLTGGEVVNMAQGNIGFRDDYGLGIRVWDLGMRVQGSGTPGAERNACYWAKGLEDL